MKISKYFPIEKSFSNFFAESVQDAHNPNIVNVLL